MWENRPAVDILLQAPCRNCDKRKKPKTCEKECVLWQDYMEKKLRLEQDKEFNKEVVKLFVSKYERKRK